MFARDGRVAIWGLLVLVLGSSWCDAGALAAELRRPNVLFILCDDLRWDCLSHAGHPHLKTPHIDRLAREGVFFKNAFCTTSLCSPSRASILSGLYAHAHGVTNNFTEYPDELASFPRLLQSAGYETGYIGKYHMGEDYEKQFPYTPNVRGVRTDEWKLVRYPHGDGGPDRHKSELYHVACDSDERCNLINDPRCSGIAAQLQGELDRLMTEVGITHDRMPRDEGVKQQLPDQKIR